MTAQVTKKTYKRKTKEQKTNGPAGHLFQAPIIMIIARWWPQGACGNYKGNKGGIQVTWNREEQDLLMEELEVEILV